MCRYQTKNKDHVGLYFFICIVFQIRQIEYLANHRARTQHEAHTLQYVLSPSVSFVLDRDEPCLSSRLGQDTRSLGRWGQALGYQTEPSQYSGDRHNGEALREGLTSTFRCPGWSPVRASTTIKAKNHRTSIYPKPFHNFVAFIVPSHILFMGAGAVGSHPHSL